MNDSVLVTPTILLGPQAIWIIARMFRACLALFAVALFGCASPKQTIKIALVAPFEGRDRQIGYDAFPAFRLALRDEIEQGGADRIEVAFIAYNDNGDEAFAERVARNVAIDGEVVAVIGHLQPTTTLAAMRVYTEAGLSLIVLSMTQNDLPPNVEQSAQARQVLAKFTDISLGPKPTWRSALAYDVTKLVIAAIRADIAANGTPTRKGVAESLRKIEVAGLIGRVRLEETRRYVFELRR